MAGEEDDLLVPGEVTEEGGGGLLPLGIKIDEGIIEEKKSVPSLEKPACHGQAQGEPERGTGAGGEGGEGDLGRVAAGRLCEVRGEALITIEGERGEDFGEVGLPGCEGVGVEFGAELREVVANALDRLAFACRAGKSRVGEFEALGGFGGVARRSGAWLLYTFPSPRD